MKHLRINETFNVMTGKFPDLSSEDAKQFYNLLCKVHNHAIRQSANVLKASLRECKVSEDDLEDALATLNALIVQES